MSSAYGIRPAWILGSAAHVPDGSVVTGTVLGVSAHGPGPVASLGHKAEVSASPPFLSKAPPSIAGVPATLSLLSCPPDSQSRGDRPCASNASDERPL